MAGGALVGREEADADGGRGDEVRRRTAFSGPLESASRDVSRLAAAAAASARATCAWIPFA